MIIGGTALQPAYRSIIKGTTAARPPMVRLEDPPEALRQTHTEEITTILRVVHRAVMVVGLKWRYNWLVVVVVVVMIDMARLEVEAPYAQAPAPWACTREDISEARALLTHHDNILEMVDRFYIWHAQCTCIRQLFPRNLASLKATT